MPVSIFDFIKPSFTDESNAVPEGQFEHTEVDMNAIKNPLSDDLMARLEDTLNRDKKAHDRSIVPVTPAADARSPCFKVSIAPRTDSSSILPKEALDEDDADSVKPSDIEAVFAILA